MAYDSNSKVYLSFLKKQSIKLSLIRNSEN